MRSRKNRVNEGESASASSPAQSQGRSPGWPEPGLWQPPELADLELLMQELDHRLRLSLELFGDNVSGLGMALARLEALEAGFFELLRSEGGRCFRNDYS